MKIKNKSRNWSRGLCKALALLIVLLISLMSAYSATEYDATESMKNAQNAISYMESKQLDVGRLNDLFGEAKILLEANDYSGVVDIAKEIVRLKDIAIKLGSELESAKSVIESAAKSGIDVSKEEILLKQSAAEFETNNYEASKSMLDEALASMRGSIGNELEKSSKLISELKAYSDSSGIGLEIVDEIQRYLQKKLSDNDVAGIDVVQEKILMLNKSVYAIIDAQKSIEIMRSGNMTTYRAEDMFKEAKFSAEVGEFEKSIEIAKEIIKLKEKSFRISGKIEESKSTINDLKSQGIVTEEIESLLQQSEEKFSINDYEEADKLLQRLIEKADIAKESSLLFGVIKKSELKFSIVNFFRAYWWLVLLIFALVFVFGMMAYIIASTKITEFRISKLKKEEQVLMGLIKKSQEDYFKKKLMSKDSYDQVVDQHQERLVKIKETIPVLETRLRQKEAKDSYLKKIFAKIKNYKNYKIIKAEGIKNDFRK